MACPLMHMNEKGMKFLASTRLKFINMDLMVDYVIKKQWTISFMQTRRTLNRNSWNKFMLMHKDQHKHLLVVALITSLCSLLMLLENYGCHLCNWCFQEIIDLVENKTTLKLKFLKFNNRTITTIMRCKNTASRDKKQFLGSQTS